MAMDQLYLISTVIHGLEIEIAIAARPCLPRLFQTLVYGAEREAAAAEIDSLRIYLDPACKLVSNCLPLAAGNNQPGLAQNPEMVRQQILRDADAAVDLLNGSGVLEQELQNSQPSRISQNGQFGGADTGLTVVVLKPSPWRANILKYNVPIGNSSQQLCDIGTFATRLVKTALTPSVPGDAGGPGHLGIRSLLVGPART